MWKSSSSVKYLQQERYLWYICSPQFAESLSERSHITLSHSLCLPWWNHVQTTPGSLMKPFLFFFYCFSTELATTYGANCVALDQCVKKNKTSSISTTWSGFQCLYKHTLNCKRHHLPSHPLSIIQTTIWFPGEAMSPLLLSHCCHAQKVSNPGTDWFEEHLKDQIG